MKTKLNEKCLYFCIGGKLGNASPLYDLNPQNRRKKVNNLYKKIIKSGT